MSVSTSARFVAFQTLDLLMTVKRCTKPTFPLIFIAAMLLNYIQAICGTSNESVLDGDSFYFFLKKINQTEVVRGDRTKIKTKIRDCEHRNEGKNTTKKSLN